MNTLDRLFSREINRRTGAHVINIYIDSIDSSRQRKKHPHEKRRSSATQDDNKPSITTRHRKRSFLYRLNLRFPWLKLLAVIVISVAAKLDLCDLTISKLYETTASIAVAPMSRHVRATERILEGKKLVALTFDDGPSSETTPRLLDILRQKDVRATFFMLGSRASTNPELVKLVEKDWHEVASHTMYHQNLIKLKEQAVQSDINEANVVFNQILGHTPSFTRPPYGNINDNVRSYVNTPMILWSVDTEDWKNKNTESIVSLTLSEVYDGGIILMHDIYPTSVDAVPVLIDTLRNDGYEFVTISELTKIRKINPIKGNAYYSFYP